MMCERCADLEERVAWLESELGLRRDAERIERLKRAIPAYRLGGRGQAAHLLDALYAAKGRTLTKLQILEALPSPAGNDERGLKLVDVVVCIARAGLGKSAIETIWGVGYRLTDEGIQIVRAIVEPQAVAA